jgi:hypothetical protein
LARTGADALLKQLKAEIAAIERTFPELASPTACRATTEGVKRKSRSMSTAARRAVSARMKKYWAERRKAQTKSK